MSKIEFETNEVQGMIQIIDLASSQGAFTGENLTQVGNFRNRLASKLKEVNEEVPEDNSQEEESNE